MLRDDRLNAHSVPQAKQSTQVVDAIDLSQKIIQIKDYPAPLEQVRADPSDRDRRTLECWSRQSCGECLHEISPASVQDLQCGWCGAVCRIISFSVQDCW